MTFVWIAKCNTGLDNTFLRTVSYKILHKIDRRLQSFVLVKTRNWFYVVIDSEMVFEEYSKKKRKDSSICDTKIYFLFT